MAHRRAVPFRLRWLFLAGLAVVALGAGCGERVRPNAIIVLVDTLRADRMSTYGYERPTTPNVDAFATQAVTFMKNRSQATCTFPSVPSLLSSRYPFEFVASIKAIESDIGPRIPPQTPYLPRILDEAGYFTAAVSSSPVVRKTPSKSNKTGGFDPGFDEFIEVKAWGRAPLVNEAVRSELLDTLRRSRSGDHPFFLYLHYTDPHDTYRPPEKKFSGAYRGQNEFIGSGTIHHLAMWRVSHPDEDPLTFVSQSDIDHLFDLYDDEIVSFDRSFGSLMDLLRAEDLYDDTLIVFASDHGEEILDHGYVKHCRPPPFDTLVNTPLLVKIPGSARSGVREHPTANLDIVPTVLDYLGIDATAHDLQGHSLRRSIEGDKARERFVYGSQFHYRYVATTQNKLILSLEDNSTQLFDLTTDEGEQQRIEDPAVTADLLARIVDWRDQTEGGRPQGEVLELEKGLEDALKAVGYLE